MYEINLSNQIDTELFAMDCARLFPSGTAFLLSGDLAAGKTVFARAFIRLLVKEPDLTVTSPTFTIVQQYDTVEGRIEHYDLYRIEDSIELDEIGMEEASRARAVLIEWPERVESLASGFSKVVRMEFSVTGPDSRKICVRFEKGFEKVETAFIFAAGLGKRMYPLTEKVPKPLVEVGGRPILDYTFSSLKKHSIRHVRMNTHYKPEQIEQFSRKYLCDFEEVILFNEPELLETGGGLKQALSSIPNDIFFAINGDVLVVDNPSRLSFLDRLSVRFDSDRMDILLLVHPVAKESITPLVGDYHFLPNGRLERAIDQKGTHMFTGVRLLHRRIFDKELPKRFSFLDLMDQAQEKGRLFGVEHAGHFHHLSTPQDVSNVSAFIKANEGES